MFVAVTGQRLYGGTAGDAGTVAALPGLQVWRVLPHAQHSRRYVLRNPGFMTFMFNIHWCSKSQTDIL